MSPMNIKVFSLFSFLFGVINVMAWDPNAPTNAEYEKIEDVQEGVYKNQRFPYINTQFESLNWMDVCEDDYVKCLVSLISSPTPVCAYHSDERPAFTFPSYCDMDLDNCRRGMIHWRLLGYGVCSYSNNSILPVDVLYGDDLEVYGNTNITTLPPDETS